MKRLLLVVPIILVLPFILNDFWLAQVITRSLIFGVIALSLSFLATYLGVVSFAQVMLAGIAGYTIAYFGPNTVEIGIELSPWFHIPLALIFSTASGAIMGLIAQRSRGIYAIMITLAIGVAFFYFTRQNYSIFNGFTGFSGIKAPTIFGASLQEPVPLYIVSMLVTIFSIFLVKGFVKSPMGLSIQATSFSPSRVYAIGIPTSIPIIAAYAFSGFIAGLGGILNVWYQERVSSFSISLGPIIDVLIIAVIGGLRYPMGAFIGAFVYVLLDVFAIDLIDRERFNMLIGTALLLIIIVAPNGLYQVVEKLFEKVIPTKTKPEKTI